MVSLLLVVYYLLTAYFYVMIAYILMGWIPELRRTSIYNTVKRISDPYMRLFRGLIVIGMMDFTPIIGFFLYRLGLSYLYQMIQIMGG